MAKATSQPSGVRGLGTVLGDYASMVAARVAGIVIALASVLVTTRLLGTDGYGRLNYLLVMPFLVVSLGSAWSSAAVLVLGREEFEASGRIGLTTWARGAAIGPVLAVTTLGVLVAHGFFGAYADFSDGVILLAMALAFLLVLVDHVTYLMQAAGEMKLSAVAQTVQRAITAGAVGALLLFRPGAGLTAYLVVSVATSAAAALYLCLRIGGRGFRPVRLDRETMRRLLIFSLPLVATTLGAFGIRWCDTLIIKLYGTYTDVGNYALAYQAYDNLFQLTVAAVSVFTPLVVSLRMGDRLDAVRQYYERLVPHALALSAVMLGVLAAPGYALVPLVFGDSFSDAAAPLLVLLVSLQFASAQSLLAVVLLGLERTRSISLVTIAGVAVNLALDFALVPAVGTVGASIATSTANVVMAVWMSWAVAGVIDAPRSRVLSASLPLVAGIAPVLIWPGVAGCLAGPLVAVLTLVLVARLTPLLVPEDAALLEQLRAPAPATRLLGRAAHLAGGR